MVEIVGTVVAVIVIGAGVAVMAIFGLGFLALQISDHGPGDPPRLQDDDD